MRVKGGILKGSLNVRIGTRTGRRAARLLRKNGGADSPPVRVEVDLDDQDDEDEDARDSDEDDDDDDDEDFSLSHSEDSEEDGDTDGDTGMDGGSPLPGSEERNKTPPPPVVAPKPTRDAGGGGLVQRGQRKSPARGARKSAKAIVNGRFFVFTLCMRCPPVRNVLCTNFQLRRQWKWLHI